MMLTNEKIVVLVGSLSDMPFARRIQDFLKEAGFPIECEYRVNSAHRHPEKLLGDLQEYERSEGARVYITVAGLSDSLSSVVAGYTTKPVIACPPDIERFGFPKIFSTIMTPKGIAVALVPNPENATLTALKILAVSNSTLTKLLQKYRENAKKAVMEADSQLQKNRSWSQE